MSTDINKIGRPDYDLDETGKNPNNYVKDEVYTYANTRFRDSNIIVPEAAPFFDKNIKIKYKKDGNANVVTLNENDYSLQLLYKGATRVIGQPLYGAILLNNLDINGQLWVSYQTVGGDQIQDREMILNKLIETVYNVRYILWDYVSESPSLYPPHPHTVNWDELYKLDDLINVLDKINSTIANNGRVMAEELRELLSTINLEQYHADVVALKNHPFTDLLNENKLLRVELDELKARIINLEKK